jgi:hypothetical protein
LAISGKIAESECISFCPVVANATTGQVVSDFDNETPVAPSMEIVEQNRGRYNMDNEGIVTNDG